MWNSPVVIYKYICDFAKRWPLSFRLNTGIARVKANVAGKNQEASCLGRCQQRAQKKNESRLLFTYLTDQISVLNFTFPGRVKKALPKYLSISFCRRSLLPQSDSE